MNEVITVGSEKYTVTNVETGLNAISFTVIDSAVGDVDAVFRDVKELTVGDTEGAVYGEYPDVEFESLTISADGRVSVVMHILNETEKQIRELQISQAEQDEAIAELLYGGGEA